MTTGSSFSFSLSREPTFRAALLVPFPRVIGRLIRKRNTGTQLVKNSTLEEALEADSGTVGERSPTCSGEMGCRSEKGNQRSEANLWSRIFLGRSERQAFWTEGRRQRDVSRQRSQSRGKLLPEKRAYAPSEGPAPSQGIALQSDVASYAVDGKPARNSHLAGDQLPPAPLVPLPVWLVESRKTCARRVSAFEEDASHPETRWQPSPSV